MTQGELEALVRRLEERVTALEERTRGVAEPPRPYAGYVPSRPAEFTPAPFHDPILE